MASHEEHIRAFYDDESRSLGESTESEDILQVTGGEKTRTADIADSDEDALFKEVRRIQNELDETRSLIAVSKYTFVERIETERRKCTEEVATLQRLFHETLKDAVNRTSQQSENEIGHLKSTVQRLESELSRLKSDKDGPNVFSAVTKTLVRKVGNLANASLTSQTPDKAEQNLEASMKSAQEANDVLKSVVLPLEDTIQELKEKLRTADKQLQVYEASQSEVIRGTEGLLELLKNSATADCIGSLEEKIQECGTSSHLEILVAYLAAQKCSLIDERDRLRSHLNDCMKLLDTERRANRELRRSQAKNPENEESVTEISATSPSRQSEIKSPVKVDGNEVVSTKSANCSHCEEVTAENVRLREEICRLQLQVQASQRESEQASQLVKEMEQKWTDVAKDYEKQVTALYSSLDQLGAQFQVSGAEFKKYRLKAEDYLRKLMYDRESVSKELTRLQEENESLLGLHSASAEQLQEEVIDLPDSVQELQYALLKLREELITAKVSKEASVKSLQRQIDLLKEQLMNKESYQQSLTNEIDAMREQLAIVYSVQTQLDEETNRRRAAESALAKNQAHVKQLQDQLMRSLDYKAKCDAEIQQLRNRVASLQTDLETSETVQRDFVQLSQQLQVQLEKIRQSEKELRWQHEDDIDNCAECKQQFTVTKRKNRCRHCGQIFCGDCLRKTVLSGPHKRPARVCNVCYYLLVPESAPFFSSETHSAAL